VYLAIARAAVVALPFRTIAPRLGIARAESPATGVADPGSGRVGRAVAAAAWRTPWRSACLEQAIAAQAMLRRRGIESTLYLGVAKDPVVAHAWLRVGAVNVTGGEDVDRYAVVASFADLVPR
jgi:Transglutaminase-like superfamily